jgi:3-isopropylmalate dehydratase small subunit
VRKFTILEGLAAVLADINIDTDAIIPKQFLKTIERVGLGKSLFYDQRYELEYKENPEFILNKDPWRNAKIIIAGDNFGCGSSREHAPWALLDFGIECIISTSFADIFYNNSIKNGLLPIILKKNDINVLTDLAFKKEMFTINLKEELISVRDTNISFNIDKIVKNRLINGYDDIELTLKNQNLIKRYERNKNKFFDWKYIE